jgi:hypothetical protein
MGILENRTKLHWRKKSEEENDSAYCIYVSFLIFDASLLILQEINWWITNESCAKGGILNILIFFGFLRFCCIACIFGIDDNF